MQMQFRVLRDTFISDEGRTARAGETVALEVPSIDGKCVMKIGSNLEPVDPSLVAPGFYEPADKGD